MDPIGQLSRDGIGSLSVKPRCYWLLRLVMSLLRFNPFFVKVKQSFVLHWLWTSTLFGGEGWGRILVKAVFISVYYRLAANSIQKQVKRASVPKYFGQECSLIGGLGHYVIKILLANKNFTRQLSLTRNHIN